MDKEVTAHGQADIAGVGHGKDLRRAGGANQLATETQARGRERRGRRTQAGAAQWDGLWAAGRGVVADHQHAATHTQSRRRERDFYRAIRAGPYGTAAIVSLRKISARRN